MTIIESVACDGDLVTISATRLAIKNNDPIDDFLHVIIVISNPCQYKRRFQLAREFIKRIEIEENVKLYIVELAYGSQAFHVTREGHPRHLQIRTDCAPLWHKENMINIGVQKLLPENWKAMAWIDADIEFESHTWAMDTLKILNGHKDIIQLFSHAIDMNFKQEMMSVFSAFGFNYEKGLTWGRTFWHPGFAWAITRKAYDKIGGLYENSILGAGDHNMALCLIGLGLNSLNGNTTDAYKEDVLNFQDRARGLRLGYTPGIIRHFFHGKKINRRYGDRWQILIKFAYDPSRHITRGRDGLICPTTNCPSKLLDEIMEYFRGRDEDETG